MSRSFSKFPISLKLFSAFFLDFLIVISVLSFTQILVLGGLEISMPIIILISLGSVGLFILLRIYSEVSSEADTSITLFKMLIGCFLSHLILIWQIPNGEVIIISSTSLSSILMVCYRALLRAYIKKPNKETKSIGIYGAGSAGLMLCSILSRSSKYKVCFFIDDNESLIGRRTGHVPIISPENVNSSILKYGVTEIALAIPSLKRKRRLEIINEMIIYGVKVMTVPPLEDIVLGKKPIEELTSINELDLLGRSSVLPNKNLLKGSITNEDVVLVTGAGGSIGGELSIQIAKLRPKKLILFDISEHALYEIERRLCKENMNCKIKIFLGSICDAQLIESIHARHKITVIFHAAAYKHVPIVEKNIIQTVKNNVLGTLALVEFCERYQIKKFILISTDKAVRPTNIMGASKRLCEMILQAKGDLDKDSKMTIYSMVRFGNVLGSSGSVVPLFKDQIKSGGPITLTSEDISRYFMSIPEAAELVIQASALADGGDLFVLDMGEPIKIFDLAKQMINLSGLSVKNDANPQGDIEIKITGLRPGEKSYEELLIGDNVKPTVHKKIMKADEDFMDWKKIEKIIRKLEILVEKDDAAGVIEILSNSVEGFDHKTY